MEALLVDRQFVIETLKANQERLRTEFGIQQIGLYGSFARNEQTEKSDVDLVYSIQQGRILGLAELNRLHRVLRRKLHRKLDMVNSENMNPFVKYYMRKDVIYV